MDTARKIKSFDHYRAVVTETPSLSTIILCDESAGDAYCEECAVKHADFDNNLFISSGSDIDPESLYCAGCGTDLSDYAEA
jgi:hypothetical protein